MAEKMRDKGDKANQVEQRGEGSVFYLVGFVSHFLGQIQEKTTEIGRVRRLTDACG